MKGLWNSYASRLQWKLCKMIQKNYASGELNKYSLTISSKSSDYSKTAASTCVNKLKSFTETKISP